MEHLWTGRGDDGTTGLYYGGRVRKDGAEADAIGSLDEAQAAIGVARSEAAAGSVLHDALTEVCRHLYVLMAEVATAPENHHKLTDGTSRVTTAMVARLEELSDEAATRFPPLTDFVVPGQTRSAALLDVARTVVRRAERRVAATAVDGSAVLPYLNRASTLLWALARAEEAAADGAILARSTPDT